MIIGAVSAANETVTNTHNTDINDPKYVNENDYYCNEDGEMIRYTSDIGSFNNVSMSNGYNAYAIQDSGYIETNDSKTHPSFWNDTYYVVDANDSETVVGHWHYANKEPIGDYLKILFYKHYDDLLNINRNAPQIPSSIFVQCFVWDLYKNAGNIDKLDYAYNKEAVNLFNQGFRVNNSGNIQWLNETTYRIFDFLGFKNADRTHMDLWGFKVTLFTITQNETNETNNNTNSTNPSGNETTNQTTNGTSTSNQNNTEYSLDKNTTIDKTDNGKASDKTPVPDNISKENSKLNSRLKTGNSTNILLIIVIVVLLLLIGTIVKNRYKK